MLTLIVLLTCKASQTHQFQEQYFFLCTKRGTNTLHTVQEPKVNFVVFQSEKDSKEEILKAFKLFDDDNTVSSTFILHVVILLFEIRKK